MTRYPPASAECRHSHRQPPDEKKLEGWRDQGILVVDVNDPRLCWDDREIIRQIARRLGYGEAPDMLARTRKLGV